MLWTATSKRSQLDSTFISALLETSNYPSYNALISNCRYWRRRLGNPPIQHNFREGNQVAQELAQQGVMQANVYYSQVYPSIPEFLTNAIQADKEDHYY